MITPKHIFDQLSKEQKIDTIYNFLRAHDEAIDGLIKSLQDFCRGFINER